MGKNTKVTDLSPVSTDKAAKITAPLSDAADTAMETARENVGLALLGAMAAGLAIGSMLPRRRKRPQKAARALTASLVAAVGELSQTLAKQANERAQAAAGDAGDKLSSAGATVADSAHDYADTLGKQAKKLSDDAGDQLHSTSKAIARLVVNLVEKAKG